MDDALPSSNTSIGDRASNCLDTYPISPNLLPIESIAGVPITDLISPNLLPVESIGP